MPAGLIIRSFRGSEGQVSVPGLGAVIATFRSWSLLREENGPAGPGWTLHAVLSYQNETLLKNEGLKRRIRCVLSKDHIEEGRQVKGRTFEFCTYKEWSLSGATLIVKGVSECPQ